MLENLDGFLLVDKPAGLAFSTVIKTVKRKFNLVKVGHGGALDAAATGLLVLLINDANKFVGDVMGADRAYEGTMKLGLKTNTHDSHGEVIAQGEPPASLDVEKTASALREMKGDIFQTESRWCSVRRENSALYEVADTGEHKPFMAHVYKFELGALENGALPFTVVGTKGLLVRTLVNDFGDLLGCGAALDACRRTRVGKFTVEEAISFDKLLEADLTTFADHVLPLSRALASS